MVVVDQQSMLAPVLLRSQLQMALSTCAPTALAQTFMSDRTAHGYQSNTMKKLDWSDWLYALMNTVIGGAATAGSAWLGMSGAKAAGMDVPVLNWKSLGIILTSGALTNLFFYLKQSPLPVLETVTTTTTTATLEKKTTTESVPVVPVQLPKA